MPAHQALLDTGIIFKTSGRRCKTICCAALGVVLTVVNVGFTVFGMFWVFQKTKLKKLSVK